MLASQTARANDSHGTLREDLPNGCRVRRLCGRRSTQIAPRKERQVNRVGGIGDRKSLSVVDHLLRIDVVFRRMLMSYTLGMTSCAESAVEKINYSA
jgi:hypothetical protein